MSRRYAPLLCTLALLGLLIPAVKLVCGSAASMAEKAKSLCQNSEWKDFANVMTGSSPYFKQNREL